MLIEVKDNEFNGGITGSIRPEIIYNQDEAWEAIEHKLINQI